MSAHCPVIVSNDSPVVSEIHERLRSQYGETVACLSFEAFQNQMAWRRFELVFLVVANDNDVREATKIVRESRLRRSSVSLILVKAGVTVQTVAALTQHVHRRISWPEKASALDDLVKAMPAVDHSEPSVAESIADRLALYTPSLLPQVSRLALAAVHDVPVLLTGETGTGKTYLARMLHEHSPRRANPFLMVPCGAQAPNLFESTFFGHVKGAFTGAHQTRQGKFAVAGKGTILLDEVDMVGLEQQASLLRVIETGEYEQVGGNETMHSEARIIVASNWDLKEAVANGAFRQDLYYRLNVMSFHLEPLRRRRQDIPLLARAIVARYNNKFNKELCDIAPDALAALEAFSWPGNIRQLENVLHEAVLISEGPELLLSDLLEPMGRESHSDHMNVAPVMPYANGNGNGHLRVNGHITAPSDTLLKGRATFERGLIQHTLESCRFNRSRAARALGISRVTLYKKMKQYGLSDLPAR